MKKKLYKLLAKIKRANEREFKKTEKILKVMEEIIKCAREEKWDLGYLIKELRFDIKIWEIRYIKKGGEKSE